MYICPSFWRKIIFRAIQECSFENLHLTITLACKALVTFSSKTCRPWLALNLNLFSLVWNYYFSLYSILKLTIWQIAKIFNLSKFKALAEDKINVTQKLKFYFGRIDNILEKGENAGYFHLLFSPNVVKSYFLRLSKSLDCVVKFN